MSCCVQWSPCGSNCTGNAAAGQGECYWWYFCRRGLRSTYPSLTSKCTRLQLEKVLLCRWGRSHPTSRRAVKAPVTHLQLPTLRYFIFNINFIITFLLKVPQTTYYLELPSVSAHDSTTLYWA